MKNDYRRMFVAIAAAATMGFGTLAGAATVSITTADGNGADTYINTGSDTLRGTNYGSNTLVTTKLSSGDYATQTVNRKAYARFDLSGYTLSATPNAVFKFSTVGWNGTATFEVYGLNDGNAGENWSESGTNWNNAPANGGAAATSNTFDSTAATLLGNFTLDASTDGTVGTFSSAALDAFLLGDTNHLVTLMFLRTTSGISLNTSFASKERGGFAPPTLQVDTIPTPAALPAGGALLGLVALKQRRRRHA